MKKGNAWLAAWHDHVKLDRHRPACKRARAQQPRAEVQHHAAPKPNPVHLQWLPPRVKESVGPVSLKSKVLAHISDPTAALQAALGRGNANDQTSGYDDDFARVWKLYGTESEKYDKALMESWKGNTDSMLNFVRPIILLPSLPNHVVLDWSVLLDSRLISYRNLQDSHT
jgi:hypothetical protein